MRYPVACIFALVASSALAEGITIEDAYARVARPGAPTGAIFMSIQNTGEVDDTLIAAASDVAKRVELHTHIEDDGVMKMRQVEGGFEVPAQGSRALQRGGDHVMLMGLTETLENGMSVEVTLTFENAGDMTLSVPVDNDRGQGGHKHKN